MMFIDGVLLPLPLLLSLPKDFIRDGNHKIPCSTWYLDNVALHQLEKKKFYKMCQALEYYPLKQIPNKQCQVIVFKGFMQEEGEKTCMPKEQGRGNPASCPKHVQGLSGLNTLKDGKSISSVGFRV